LYVQFEWFQPGQAFQLLLTSRHLRGLKSPRRFSIHYGDDGAVHQIDRYHTGAAKDGTPTVFVMRSSLNANNEESASRASAEMEAAITRISVAWREKRLVLATGSLEKPLAEVRKCTDQLLEAWGLDPAQQRSRSRPPIPSDPGRWLVGWDYPERALRKGAQSLINFRLTVGPDGQPTACEVQGSYSGELFAKRTCQLLMIRARFQPALDAKGQAIPSYYVNQVSWLTGLP
jgi:outer membrane biosynthesis protein TonB